MSQGAPHRGHIMACTACTIRATVGVVSVSSVSLNGTGMSWAPTRATGASRSSKASSITVAAISAPLPEGRHGFMHDDQAMGLASGRVHRLTIPGADRPEVDHLGFDPLLGESLRRLQATVGHEAVRRHHR